MVRLKYLIFLVGLFATGCAAATPTPFIPTATLRGAVVPTRVIPTKAPTEVGALPSDTPTLALTDTPTEAPTLTEMPVLTLTPSDTPTLTATPSDTPTSTPTDTPTPATPVARAMRDIMVRSGPGSQYPTLIMLEANERLDIIGISEDGSWYQVQLPDGSIGWLVTSETLVRASGDIAAVPIAATPTPIPTDTPSHTPTATDTATNTPTPTNTPTNTPTSTDTPTLTFTPSDTPTITDTPSHTPTATDTPTDMPTATDRPSPTSTNTATATDTPTSAATATDTPTRAAESQRITLGETREGTIDASAPVVSYTFEAAEGDTVRLRLVSTSGDLDPTLVLLDPQGIEIARNDDESFTVKDAFIERTLPADGVYTILATRYREEQGGTAGTFRLSLEIAETVLSSITLGETVNGALDDATYEQRYTFEGQAGEIVTIDMNAAGSALDSVLILLGPNGEQLIENDDASTNTRDARIAGYTLPESGTYTIVATRYEQQSGDTSGRFTLTLSEGSADVGVTEVTTVSDTINDEQPGLIYTYTTTNTQEVVTFDLVATSGDLDPLLIVISPDGREIIRNDDAEEGTLNSRISNLPLDEVGEYSIIATRFLQGSGTTSGTFDLTVSAGVRGAAVGGTFSQFMEWGDTLSGRIERSNQQDIYTFYAEAGDRVTLSATAESGNLDPVLILTDNYGNEIARNDDAHANTKNSQLTDIELTVEGYYTVIVMPYEGTGTYQITLE